MKQLVVLFFVFLSGCASISSDSTQSVRLETVTTDGVELTGADCKLVNDRGHYEGKTPATVLVRKSSANLDITCAAPEQAGGVGALVSRAGAGMWGNILFGGGIGAIIDHNKGTAYNYPNWVRIVMGKRLVYDRSNSADDKPTPGFAGGDGQGTPVQERPKPQDTGTPVAVRPD